MKKTEAPLTTKWKKWAFYNLTESFMAEVKWCPTGRFNFKSGSFPKELRLLLQAKHSKVIHKQSDIAMMGTLCDVWGLIGSRAWVVLFFDKKKFYMLDVDVIQGAIDDGKKSLTEEEAKRYSDLTGTLK
jgi:hypothetical protein